MRTWAVTLVTLTGNSYSFQFSQRAHDDVTLASSGCYKSIYSYHVFLGLSFLFYKSKQVGQDQRLHNDILRDCFVWPMQGFVCLYMFKTILKKLIAVPAMRTHLAELLLWGM